MPEDLKLSDEGFGEFFFHFLLLKFYLEPAGAATGTLQKFCSQWKEQVCVKSE